VTGFAELEESGHCVRLALVAVFQFPRFEINPQRRIFREWSPMLRNFALLSEPAQNPWEYRCRPEHERFFAPLSAAGVPAFQNASGKKRFLCGRIRISFPQSGASLERGTPAADSGAKTSHAQVDTYIPKGFVLVPIEVQNYEALDSILENSALWIYFKRGN